MTTRVIRVCIGCWLLLAVWLGMCGAVQAQPQPASAAPATQDGAARASSALRNFDHLGTGYALTGAHRGERCESCHAGGVFKGTPRDCASCHTLGGSRVRSTVLKPARHVPGNQVCDTCHDTRSFANARFSHAAVVAGSCQSCHNGVHATGKPAGHVATTASCSACHTTQTWGGAKPDHSGFNASTNCASCHNGSSASAKPARHIPVGLTNCIACHSTRTWRPSSWNHTQTVVTAQCASCHNGAYPPADGKPANHVPYTLITASASSGCDACHKGYASWGGAKFHASVRGVASQCSTCHTGSYPGAVGKPANAVHAGVTLCESCHSTATWAGAKVNHSGFNASTSCASCHNGSAATGKPASHIPTGAVNCLSCHSTSAWKPSSWNHTQTVVAAQCASCHSGAYAPADGKPTNHVPYTLVAAAAGANCDSCHKSGYLSWASPAKLHSSLPGISSQCATCHTGSYGAAVGKPSTPTHVGVTVCESCHRSTSNWLNVAFGHSPANAVGSGTCDTCHNGSTATGKPAAHIPIRVAGVKCDGCHKSQTSWATVTMNHTALSAQACNSCHVGAYASQGAGVKPANHIPEAQLLNGALMDCKACHTGTSSWAAVKMNHNASQGNGSGWCKSCHASGTAYLGGMERKSLTHEARGATDCSQSGCHRPLGNKGAAYTRWD